MFVASAAPARAEPLYDFVVSCKAAPVRECFERIEAEIKIVRRMADGRTVCMPMTLIPSPMPMTSYPVAFLDYVLLRLSAARIGSAGRPVPAVLEDVLADMYPCRRTAGRPSLR